MKTNRNSEFTPVFEGELWQSSLIKQLLDEFHIPAFLSNEYMSNIERPVINPAGIAPVIVSVSTEQAEQALKLIEEYQNNIPSEE